MRTILASLIAAFLLTTAPALAQEPPTTIGLGEHNATFDSEADVDTYRFQLQEAKDYAVGIFLGSNFNSEWTLYGPTGTQLWQEIAGEGDGIGNEFRAGRTGYFKLVGTALGSSGAVPPVGYSLRIEPDCRAGLKTKCTFKPGQTRADAMSSAFDDDWLKLAELVRGRWYTATIVMADSSNPTFEALEVHSGTGVTVFEGGSSIRFRASASTAFLAVITSGNSSTTGQPYKLSLRAG
jgi:hypothetical protein